MVQGISSIRSRTLGTGTNTANTILGAQGIAESRKRRKSDDKNARAQQLLAIAGLVGQGVTTGLGAYAKISEGAKDRESKAALQKLLQEHQGRESFRDRRFKNKQADNLADSKEDLATLLAEHQARESFRDRRFDHRESGRKLDAAADLQTFDLANRLDLERIRGKEDRLTEVEKQKTIDAGRKDRVLDDIRARTSANKLDAAFREWLTRKATIGEMKIPVTEKALLLKAAEQKYQRAVDDINQRAAELGEVGGLQTPASASEAPLPGQSAQVPTGLSPTVEAPFPTVPPPPAVSQIPPEIGSPPAPTVESLRQALADRNAFRRSQPELDDVGHEAAALELLREHLVNLAAQEDVPSVLQDIFSDDPRQLRTADPQTAALTTLKLIMQADPQERQSLIQAITQQRGGQFPGSTAGLPEFLTKHDMGPIMYALGKGLGGRPSDLTMSASDRVGLLLNLAASEAGVQYPRPGLYGLLRQGQKETLGPFPHQGTDQERLLHGLRMVEALTDDESEFQGRLGRGLRNFGNPSITPSPFDALKERLRRP